MPVSLERTGEVSLLRFDDGENRFTREWLDQVDRALDAAVAGTPTALVTVGTGKFYSNGLDVEELTRDLHHGGDYLARVQGLLAKMLTLGVPTVAAVNGHAFGGGAMLALAHDFRIMNSEKGFFCFPEVDLKLSFAPGMARLIQSKTAPAVAAPDEIVADAIDRAATLVGKDAATLAAIKGELFGVDAAALRS